MYHRLTYNMIQGGHRKQSPLAQSDAAQVKQRTQSQLQTYGIKD